MCNLAVKRKYTDVSAPAWNAFITHITDRMSTIAAGTMTSITFQYGGVIMI